MRYVGFDNGQARDYREIVLHAQHNPIATEVSADEYFYMLNVMPPIYCRDGGFMVCEALCDSDAGAIHAMYRQIGDRYYAKHVVRGVRHTYITTTVGAYPIDPEHARIAAEQMEDCA